jgi:hypothetical protein
LVEFISSITLQIISTDSILPELASWTPKGYITIARHQSDWALFTLGINLAKSAPLCTGTALELHEVNKPQATISGVGISIAL